MSFEQKREEAVRLFGKIFSYYIILAGLLSGLFYIFAYPVVKIFTHANFYSSYIVIGLTTTALFILPIFNIFLIPLYYEKNIKILPIFQIISAGIFVLSGLVLIPVYGIIGAALNMILGYLMMAVFTHLWCYKSKSKYIKIKYEWRRIGPFIMIYCLFIVFILTIKTPLINLIINTIIFFCLIFYTFFILTQKEKQIIKESFLGQTVLNLFKRNLN
jgi:O-antigen/teichoic acid export membrane protein